MNLIVILTTSIVQRLKLMTVEFLFRTVGVLIIPNGLLMQEKVWKISHTRQGKRKSRQIY